MSLVMVMVAHTFIAGALGMPARLYIAGFLLSTESIKSPRKGVRYFYRYLVFCFYYLISFMLTPMLIKPFIEHFENITDDTKSYLYLFSCIPLAVFFYYLDYKFIVWGDVAKLRARKALRKKS